MNNVTIRRYAWSYLIALVLTILLAVVADVPGYDAAGWLLAAGMILAGIFFSTGIHSAWPMAYLVTAGLIDAFLLAWLVMGLWTMVVRFRHGKEVL